MSVMDVVHGINDSKLILPAGDVRIARRLQHLREQPGGHAERRQQHTAAHRSEATVLAGDVGHVDDGRQLQTKIVRVDGQHSVYNSRAQASVRGLNTIPIVNGIRNATAHLLDIPQQLRTAVALALAVVIALFCSYVVAMTVVPLVRSKLIKPMGHGVEHESAEVDDPMPEPMSGGHGQQNIFARIVLHFNRAFGWLQSPTMRPSSTA